MGEVSGGWMHVFIRMLWLAQWFVLVPFYGAQPQSALCSGLDSSKESHRVRSIPGRSKLSKSSPWGLHPILNTLPSPWRVLGSEGSLGIAGCSQATLAPVQVLFTQMFIEQLLCARHCSRLQGYSNEQNEWRCCSRRNSILGGYLSSGFWQICSPWGPGFLDERKTRTARSLAEAFCGNSSSRHSWCGRAAGPRVEQALRAGLDPFHVVPFNTHVKAPGYTQINKVSFRLRTPSSGNKQ